jgi:hypothetical protein
MLKLLKNGGSELFNCLLLVLTQGIGASAFHLWDRGFDK